MAKEEDGFDIMGILKIAIPLLVGGIIVLFLLVPSTFESATKSVKGILPNKKGNNELGILGIEELDQLKAYNSLAEAFKNPDDVRVLKLGSQNLEEVPASIAQFKKMQVLELQNNRIEFVAKEIGQLPFLQYLFLSNNKITVLPEEIGQPRYLKLLHLAGNHLRALPDAMGYLYNLEELDASNNKLLAINPQIGNLRKLKILRLRNNQITKIPQELSSLDSLQFIDLSANKSLNIRETILALSKIPNLQRVDLSGLGLTIIPKEIAELRKIKGIILRGNKLSASERQNAKNFLPNAVIDF